MCLRDRGKEASRRALEEDKELAARIYSEITAGKPESTEEPAEEAVEPEATAEAEE